MGAYSATIAQLVACGAVKSDTSSLTDAIPQLSSQSIFSGYGKIKQTPYFKQLLSEYKQLRFSELQTKLLAGATDSSFGIDGVNFTTSSKRLSQSGLANADKSFKNIGEFWRAIGFSPNQTVNAASFKDGLTVMARIHKTPSEIESSLDFTVADLRAMEATRLVGLAYAIFEGAGGTENDKPGSLGLDYVITGQRGQGDDKQYRTCVSKKAQTFMGPSHSDNTLLQNYYKFPNEHLHFGDIEPEFIDCARSVVSTWPKKHWRSIEERVGTDFGMGKNDPDAEKIYFWGAPSGKILKIESNKAQEAGCSTDLNNQDWSSTSGKCWDNGVAGGDGVKRGYNYGSPG